MRLPTLSAALSLLLIALSCLTARCDASCDLAALHGSCHHATSSTTMQAHPEVHCTGMSPSATHHPVLAAPAGPCPQHQVCLSPVTPHPASTPALSQATLPPPVAVLALRLPVPSHPRFPAPTFFGDPPLLRSTSLRV